MPAETHFIPFLIEDTKSLIATIIGFVLFAALIWKFGIPILGGMLQARSLRIEADQTQVERELADIEQLRNDYANRLAQIETEARQRIDEAVREAEVARTEIIAEARQSAAYLRQRAEEELARERTRQRILLRQQIVQTTLDSAEEAVRAHSSDAVQRHLIQDFITRAASDGKSGVSSATSQTKGA